MKGQVSAHVKGLIKKMQDEEQDLQKRIDARIHLETEYIYFFLFFYMKKYFFYRKVAVTEREQQYLKKNKAALDQITDKYREYVK